MSCAQHCLKGSMFSRASLRLMHRVAIPTIRQRTASHQAFRRTAGIITGLMAGTFVGGVTVVSCWGASSAPVDLPYDLKAVKRDIEEMLGENMALGPTIVRLVWQEAGSWDCKKKDGSPNSASMRLKPECAYGGNTGLDVARDALEPLKRKYPSMSYADLWVFAAYTAIEYMGGPSIPFSWGRADAKDGSVCGPDGRLPDASKTQSHVREVFTRLGFDDRETVALIGAHTIGECRLQNTGYVGPWTHDKYGFDNSFFLALLEEEWELNPDVESLQFMDRETKKLMMLPADVAIRLDPEYYKYAVMYAKDNDVFCQDFAAAFQKLTELGTHDLHETEPRS